VSTTMIPLPSGKLFDFANPHPDMIDIEDIALALSKDCRFGGFCDGHYSVAQHSVLGAMQIDEEFALEFLLHDAAEAYCGDVVSPLKRLLCDYNIVESRVDAAIRKKFGLPAEMSPPVKAMDDAMYHTERRDLTSWADAMISRHHMLSRPMDAIPHLKIKGWEWEHARQEFLRIFNFLTMAEK
jgi:hypothetical protein